MAAGTQSDPLPVQQARTGCPEAWDALFRRYQLPLYAYVFELVRDEQSSLDILQESFIAAVRHLAGLRDDRKFGSWLFGIAHQKCLQRFRQPHREVGFEDGEPQESGDPAEGPDDILIRREQEEEFMKFVNQLPPAHRSVLLLHYLEDFPLDEIALITGVPLGTVKSRLHHARVSLRDRVSDARRAHSCPSPS